MSNIEMIKELRALTQAGMKDCKDALNESGGDINKAVDLIKARGKLVASGSRTASEGLVNIVFLENRQQAAMVETNCVTDFVANSPEFRDFCDKIDIVLAKQIFADTPFQPQCEEIEEARKSLQAITKENIVIRRWWIEQVTNANEKIFSYVHPNEEYGKIGVLLSAKAMTKEFCDIQDFETLCDDLAMQIAAMNPLAISSDKLDPALIERQRAIFHSQIESMNKPAAAYEKIMEGKMNKWYTEVCLLNQESVVHPKLSVAQVIKNAALTIGEVTLMKFIRCQVGEGVDKPQDDFVSEAIKMAGE